MTHAVLITPEASALPEAGALVDARLAAGALVRVLAPIGMEGVPGVDERCVGPGRLQTFRFPERELRRECLGTWDEVILTDPAVARAWRGLLSTSTRCRFLRAAPEGDPRRDAGVWLPGEEGTWRVPGDASAPPRIRRALVVGAGIAGAFTAYELARRGVTVDVIDRWGAPANGASALRAAIIHPHWQAADGPTSRLTRLGFGRMLNLLDDFPEVFDPCGVMDVAEDDAEWAKWCRAVEEGRPFPVPEDFARLTDRDAARGRTGLPLARGGWWFPKAGVVRPALLARRLLEASGARVLMGAEVRLTREDGLWRARFVRGGAVAAEAEAAVAASALDACAVLDAPADFFGLSPLYGRISLLRDTDFRDVRCAVTGHGYLVRTEEGFCGVGATYEQGTEPQITAVEAHDRNMEAFSRLLTDTPEALWGGYYAGVRAVARDRMPLAGPVTLPAELEGLTFRGRPELKDLPVTEGLWGLFGLGSRGLTWGRILAEHVAAEMTGEPTILPASLARAVAPGRFAPVLSR